MDEVEYRWNWYGTRKHIFGQGPADQFGFRPNTLCGQAHQDRQSSESRHSQAKLDAAPLCKTCAKKSALQPCPHCNGTGVVGRDDHE